jgi:mono/diheme cytochrome c family protein
VKSRFVCTWIVAGLALGLAGCGDALNAGPLSYLDSPRLAADLKGRPKLQAKVHQALATLYGNDPQDIHVPAGTSGVLRFGGYYLANYVRVDEKGDKAIKPLSHEVLDPTGKPLLDPAGKPQSVPQAGGYSLYRLHCLHCHGVSGAGDGPTADFLYPRPRDYRKGLFKFTSTPTGAKPTRKDLRKTIVYGLHGTSMPAFESLMSAGEIEQVLDYVIFLSLRGETELGLIDEANIADENDPQALSDDIVHEIARGLLNKWRMAESQVVDPPIPRPPATHESILRGRDLFLSRNTTGNKVDCTSCHGPQAVGNGPSMVAQEVFNDVVFGGNPSAQAERLARYDDKTRELWRNSLDDWGNALRPANLNRGIYKGGRRPIDLYWRIAKGINGAKMPAHYPTIEPERIWDLVNFVLALPYEPKLLEGATLPSAPPATAPKVARR